MANANKCSLFVRSDFIESRAESAIRPISLTSTNSHASTASTTSSTSVGSSTSMYAQIKHICLFRLIMCFALDSRQATNTVEELLFNEEIYIRSLSCGIDGYMKRFEQKQMPNDLRGQQYRVFGNIHRIRDFHETEFFPALRRCDMSIVKICRTFCEFIEVSASSGDE